MVKTQWKSAQEIQFSLNTAENVGIFSCGVCANLAGNGGIFATKTLEKLLDSWGKNVLFSRCINICCSDEVMRQALSIHLAPVADKCDALLLASCSGGIKTAVLCDPGVTVVAALDSMGSSAITRKHDPVVKSLCTGCGHCVLSFTGGICPVALCPARRLYTPCKKWPKDSGPCAINPNQECVFKLIESRGNLEALAQLETYAKTNGNDGTLPRQIRKTSPGWVKKTSGWVMARTGKLSGIVRIIN